MPDWPKSHVMCSLLARSLTALFPADDYQVLLPGRRLAASLIPTGHFHFPSLGSEVTQGHLCLFFSLD